MWNFFNYVTETVQISSVNILAQNEDPVGEEETSYQQLDMEGRCWQEELY